MKKIKRSALIIAVLLLVVVAIPSPMHAESLTKLSLSAEAESWYYPVLPGDEEWALLTTKEKYEVCNMPNELLEVCSTEHLADLLLDYPFLLEFWAYDKTEDGLAHVERKSNIYKEFFSRQEAIDVLIEKYTHNIVDYILLKDSPNKYDQSLLDVSGCTTDIFSQVYLGSTYNTLTTNQISKISFALSEKYENQKEAKSCSFFNSLIFTEVQKVVGTVPAEVIPKNMYADILNYEYIVSNLDWDFISNGQSQTVNPSIPTSSSYDANFFPITYSIVETYGTVYHEYYGNATVDAKYIEGDLNFNDRNLVNQYFQSRHNTQNEAYFVSDASFKYNCHFYAWINDFSKDTYWIFNPSNFYTDPYSSVTKVSTNGLAAVGDIVCMKSFSGVPEHSAVVTMGGTNRINTYVSAKMGFYGVYVGSIQFMFEVYDNADFYDVYR